LLSLYTYGRTSLTSIKAGASGCDLIVMSSY